MSGSVVRIGLNRDFIFTAAADPIRALMDRPRIRFVLTHCHRQWHH